MDTVSNSEILAEIAAELQDWRKLAQPLAARYRAADAVDGAAFVAAVAQAGAAVGHGVPVITLGNGYIDVTLFSVDEAGGRWITAKDLELAGVISGLAHDFGLTAAPGEVAQLELALDTADYTAAGPFWAALLGGDAGRAVLDSVFDAKNRVPNVWFQQTDAHRTPRQRWHMDLWLAPEVAAERIAASVAAGGTLVDDSEAPSFTVLADPEGNRVCVCTALGRD
ncbi:VOC family protein [Streptomyces sp. BE230]|uniref:VOC family protein n=1 Tax=Streptomyces sp. BE230 TaxID=3002526 RepID=UPI002ED4BC0A|nr:VOC family protein [Streptomyces sp. BE230]